MHATIVTIIFDVSFGFVGLVIVDVFEATAVDAAVVASTIVVPDTTVTVKKPIVAAIMKLFTAGVARVVDAHVCDATVRTSAASPGAFRKENHHERALLARLVAHLRAIDHMLVATPAADAEESRGVRTRPIPKLFDVGKRIGLVRAMHTVAVTTRVRQPTVAATTRVRQPQVLDIRLPKAAGVEYCLIVRTLSGAFVAFVIAAWLGWVLAHALERRKDEKCRYIENGAPKHKLQKAHDPRPSQVLTVAVLEVGNEHENAQPQPGYAAVELALPVLHIASEASVLAARAAAPATAGVSGAAAHGRRAPA
mmetsp:Transcript_9023/g.23560  ORF Transcript_9023/g.23560 Transcript_9023/m.23560 type:complete len:309 (+) Transcript_9023:1059-1985(+)